MNDDPTDLYSAPRMTGYFLRAMGGLVACVGGFMFWFFYLPLYSLFRMSLSSKASRFAIPTFAWEWANYRQAFSQYGEQFQRSFTYALAATLIALLIAYPVAYFIAFKAGRVKNILLGLVMVPFFTSFLIRTLAWQTILADDGAVANALRWAGILGQDGRLLATSFAVVAGITYNFLPFMVLPIYVSLEKIDPRLLDAARDLYSNTWRGFRKVIVPLSLPGVFAGSLLVFIPAAGDFVNAYYLGNARTTMIGNVVQDQFLVQNNYPVAAALSFVFIAIVMVIVGVYSRLLGTEELV